MTEVLEEPQNEEVANAAPEEEAVQSMMNAEDMIEVAREHGYTSIDDLRTALVKAKQNEEFTNELKAKGEEVAERLCGEML